MVKVKKKKNRKLRRQIRKTVGALLMASAITVAAVPVSDVSANPTVTEKIKVAVTSKQGEIKPEGAAAPEFGYASTVPYAQERPGENTVYTSGDGMFQFVYTKIDDVNRGAVILNFNNVHSSDTITIPAELQAYRKYSPNNTFRGYCLVTLNDEFLGYKTYEQKTNEYDQLLYRTVNHIPDLTTGAVVPIENLTPSSLYQDETDGNLYYNYTQTQWADEEQTTKKDVAVRCRVEPVMGDVYRPCYYEQMSRWETLGDEELYYLTKKDNGDDNYGNENWLPATSSEHWRIEAQVAYIGAEKIIETDTGWQVSEYRVSPQEGVFAERNDITNLVFEGSIKGISDYAFYHCWTLSNVEFKSGLETLGNGAFAECAQLENVTIPRNAQVQAIGKDAFYNCRSLKNFTVPDGLQGIGDCAFENCISLESVNLLGSGRPVALEHLGNHLFRGCESLSGIEFPNGYSEILDIDMFQGCTSLQFVKLPDTNSGSTLNFVCKHSEDNINYPNCQGNTWENFRNTVPENFYFEGPSDSDIHETAKDNEITFKYPNQELYEKVVYEHDVNDADDEKTAKTIYQVNNSGDLVKFEILDGSHPDIITIPEMVGAFGIERIGQGSFNNNCDLVKVTVPASVKEIGDNAFRGCHNLRTVIFTDAANITSIGNEAFRTQVTGCSHSGSLYPAQGAEKPKLYFVGAMLNSNNEDTETFKYAMNGSSRINHNSSEDLWITCHSGWPTNLEVEYYSDSLTQTGEAQLVGYPRYVDLLDGADAWAENLPYVTNEENNNAEYYANIIKNVLAGGNLTPDEQEFRSATLNVVIPASVDSIKPGLFSGWTYETKEDDPTYKLGEAKPVYEVGEDGSPTTNQIKADEYIESILINGVDRIEPYTFKDCTNLKAADVIGSRLIDDYAFEDCEALENVTLGPNLEDTGKRPFKGCGKLSNINSLNPNFSYNSGILYRSISNGLEIVESLENRGAIGGSGSYAVGPDELAGVTSIKPEAFADCDEISQVDLSKTTVSIIPEGCFKNTELNSIVLPSTLKKIEADSFKNGGAKRLIVYFKGDPTTIADYAFENEDPAKQQEIIFQCLKESNADYYAMDYKYITSSDEEVYQEFTVEFWNLPDYPLMTNMELIDRQTVRAGEDAVPPEENPVCNDPNLVFIGWSEYKNIQADTAVYAIYGSPEFTVIFRDGYTGTVLKTETVKYGGAATPPSADELPVHEGQIFTGWSDLYYNITEDKDIIAIYHSTADAEKCTVTFYSDGKVWGTPQRVNPGESAIIPVSPTKEGYTFVGWVWTPETDSSYTIKENTIVVAQFEKNDPSGNPITNPSASPGTNPGANPSGSGNNTSNGSNATPTPNRRSSSSATPTPTATPGSDVKKYTVSVSGGSGSGSYAAGQVVSINAYFMGEGQVFDKWTSSTAGVGFANPNASSTTFTMPASNVAVTATYKTGGSGTAATNASSGGSGSGNSGTVSANNGTTVDVTKPGFSNTNLAGATVSGATDNFVIKVTEDQSATDAATAALQARYGSLDRIKYLPMDISLYDSTGRTKIADTSGISVNLTLPLPDDLVQYAGNNRVAAVSNGQLEDLSARFTTVGGVPCINFTATHFSPYVIYVDTANLTEATIDATPKTGDPIHPKWFLSLGMACVALILFFKRDKAVVVNKKAA